MQAKALVRTLAFPQWFFPRRDRMTRLGIAFGFAGAVVLLIYLFVLIIPKSSFQYSADQSKVEADHYIHLLSAAQTWCGQHPPDQECTGPANFVPPSLSYDLRPDDLSKDRYGSYYNWFQPADAVRLAHSAIALFTQTGAIGNPEVWAQQSHLNGDWHYVTDANLVLEANGIPTERHRQEVLASATQHIAFASTAAEHQQSRTVFGIYWILFGGQTLWQHIAAVVTPSVIFYLIFKYNRDWISELLRIRHRSKGPPRIERIIGQDGVGQEVVVGDMSLLRRIGQLPGLASNEGPLRVQYVQNVHTGGWTEEVVGNPLYVPLASDKPALSKYVQVFDPKLNKYVWQQIIEGNPNLEDLHKAALPESDLHGGSKQLTREQLDDMNAFARSETLPPEPLERRQTPTFGGSQTLDRGQLDDMDATSPAPSPPPPAAPDEPEVAENWRIIRPGEVFQPGRRFKLDPNGVAQVLEPPTP